MADEELQEHPETASALPPADGDKEPTRTRFFTPAEVAAHNRAEVPYPSI